VTPEAQRIQALRAQDGRPFEPPAGLQSLVVGGKIPDFKVQEAFAAWQSSRQELVATNSFDAAERLLFLAMILPQTGQEMAPLQKRAFYEASAEIMTIPRHRQLILGQIVRAAAREGDLRAAEAWLGLCDPAPDDLDMDTAYRASRAFLHTMKNEYNDVVAVLGSGTDDIPIADLMDVYCGVMRANAWEKLGRVDVAVFLLDKELKRGAGTVASIVEKQGMCPQSYQQAKMQHDQASADKVAASSGGSVGGVLMFVGATQGLIGVGLLVAAVANYLGLVRVMGPPGNFGAVSGAILPGVIMGAVALVLMLIGFNSRRKAKRARYIRLHGKPATAQLTQASRTGTRINNVPQWELHLTVQLPDQAPYQTSTKMVLTDATIANMQGKTLHVRVAPDNPSDVVLQLH